MAGEGKLILGLDVSTTCIGCCLMIDDGTDYGKIVSLTHVVPKVSSKIKGIESLFIKKRIFNDEFLSNWKGKGISEVVIEEPLLRSNNVETCGTLLRFNGMISDCVYTELGIVPEYISSYDARKYSFPQLMSIRKYNKQGVQYPYKKIMKEIQSSSLVLFGAYPWEIDKKAVIQGMVSEVFPDIQWLYNKKGELKKENFDACDAYVACLGYRNKIKNGEPEFEISDIEEIEDGIKYNVSYWDKKVERITYADKKVEKTTRADK